jgi:trk system potassium uptake protein TrkA
MYIIIVGVGNIGYFLARRLIQDKNTVALVEKNKERAEQVAQSLTDILVIHGDGCDMQILKQAGISKADVLAAVTGDDEDNLVICQIAKEEFNISRTVARVNDPANQRAFTELGVDVPIDSTEIIARIIEEEASFSDLVTLMTFKKGKLAIVRVDLNEDSPVVNQALKDIQLPQDSVLISIVRGDEIIVPKGDTVLLAKDDVVALTLIQNEKQLLKFLVGEI